MATRRPVKKAAARKAPVSPGLKFAQEIAAGRHDADLGEIVKAVYLRAMETDRGPVWRMVIGVHEFKSEEVTTIGVMVDMEERTGLPWTHIKQPDVSARFASAWATCLLVNVVGMTEDDAEVLVSSILADELLEGVRREIRGPAPKA